MADSPLFSGFEPVSAKQWKQKIQMDLRGADYNETLVWETLEGIKVKPFYHAEDLKNQPHFSSTAIDWKIGQHIEVTTASEANKKAQDTLLRGAESLILQLPKPDIDWQILCSGIDLETTPIHIDTQLLQPSYFQNVLSTLKDTKATVYLHQDIIGNLCKTGNWHHGLREDHIQLEQLLKSCEGHQGISALSCDMALYQNAGADMVQQLAYGLAHANEYLNHFVHKNGQTLGRMTFKVAVGGNYFFEIAKLKALRWLWGVLTETYEQEIPCHILALPSLRNKTIYDYNVNLLRTTSECMSAILGGADTICNLRYDTLYHEDNEFADRIARNQLVLLKTEAHLAKAAQHSDGAYYLETLTRQLAEKALQRFKELEAGGGFLQYLKKGIIQRKIKENAAKEQELFDAKTLVSVGTNTFQNPNERMKQEVQRYPFAKKHKRKTLIVPVTPRRLAEKLEKSRLESE